MTTRVVASAPGKLVILGEYLVLEGGPCLVAAVDRRARVEVRRASGAEGRLAVWMPAAEQHRFAAGQPSGLELVDQVREALGLTARVFDADLDTRACFDSGSGEKLGIGSSAALSCALWAALQVLFQPTPTDLSYRGLDRLRTVLQGGGGSGVDLAASFGGGLQRFERTRPEDPARVEAVAWPDTLSFCAVFAGHGAVTTDFIGAYQAWRQRPGRPRSGLRAALGETAAAGCAAVAAGDAGELLGALDRYGVLMGQLGEAMGKAVVTPAHARLAEVARDLGGAYKPSGAGGGDVGIAGFTDSRALLAFKQAVAAQGLAIPELTIEPQGLTVEQQES